MQKDEIQIDQNGFLNLQTDFQRVAPVASTLPWIPIVWFGSLLLLLYAPVLARLSQDWIRDEDMGHGFFVPAIAAWIVWQRRAEIIKVSCRTNYWGLFWVALGGVQLVLATLGVELFLSRVAFIISLTGVILTVCGAEMLKNVSFPLFLLVFMIPLPAIIYSQITFPLQIFATQVAEFSLSGLGIPVIREGNILELANQRLSVVEACSGIRSLLSLSFLSLVYAYWFDEKPWMRWVLLTATIPVAIIANAGRVTMTGILSEYNQELAQGFFHSLEGWLIFMIALVALVLVHQLVNRAFGWYHVKRNRQLAT